MISSFWTLIDDTYYRLKNRILLETNDNTFNTFHQVEVTSLSSTILEKINYEFGTNYQK